MMGFDGRGPTLIHKLIYHLLEQVDLYKPDQFVKITKTITIVSICGPRKVWPLRDGWKNRWGLHNPGLSDFVRKYTSKIKEDDKIIISFMADNIADIDIIIKSLSVLFPNLVAVEYNVSCPNLENKKFKDTGFIIAMCKYIVAVSKFPLILKIGKDNEYLNITKATKGIVQAVNINSVPDGCGGISGKIAQNVNWRIVKDLTNNTSTPIIGPSVWNYDDIEKLFNLGVKAISFGSVSMIHPIRLIKEGKFGPVLPTIWTERWQKEQEEKDRFLKSSARVGGRK